MKPTKREIKRCYNKLHSVYRVYVRRQGKDNWNEFTLDKKTLEHIIKQNFKFSGDDYKLNPYKPYIKHLIKWNIKIYWKRFLSLNKPLTKFFDSGFVKGISFLLILLTFVFQDKCSKKTTKDTSRVKIDQLELNQELIKPIEKHYQENYGIDVQKPNNEALKQNSLTKHKTDSLK